MSKAVLISIRPKWCELIARGEKTLEVRKNKPKLETPFRCYIYQTKQKWSYDYIVGQDRMKTALTLADGQSKVVGEFVCDGFIIDRTFGHDPLLLAAACMSEVEAATYCVNSETYGWHISGLVIYDKPKPLSEFQSYESSVVWKDGYPIPTHEIKRPPQSWFYVKEVAADEDS